jgi:nucleotide-binding universal stress UspA family protein
MDFKKKNIIVAMDFRDQAFGALHQAITISQHLNRQIILLYINQEKGVLSSFFSNEQNELFDNAVLTKMEDLAKEKSNEHKVEIITHLVHHNSIHVAITEFAAETQSDLIVMGRGDGGDNQVIGSNTAKVLKTSKTPVITVCKNCQVTNKYRSILLPLDLSKETRQKVNWGVILAKIFGAKIRVVSALWSKTNENIVTQLNAQMLQVEKFITKQGVECTTEMIESTEEAKTMVPIILKYADEAGDIDLIMIMTQQENSFTEFFLGSSATDIIRKSNVPVMSIIPHDTGQIVWGM